MKLRHKINKIMRGVKKAQKMGWTIEQGYFIHPGYQKCCPLIAAAVIAKRINPDNILYTPIFDKYYGKNWASFVNGVDGHPLRHSKGLVSHLTGKYVWNLIEKEVKKNEFSNNTL